MCAKDNIEIEKDAFLEIAKKADGSMRDAQSILDQIISFCGEKIQFDNVAQALGVIHQDLFFRLSELILEGNVKDIILLAQEIFDSGYDLTELLHGLEEHFRNILVTLSMNSTELIEVSENYLGRYKEISQKFNEHDLIAYLKIIADTIVTVKTSQQPQLKFELGLIKLVKLPASKDIETILEKLDLLKKKANFNKVAENATIDYSSEPTSNQQTEDALNIDIIKNKWEDVVKDIHSKKPTLATVLEKSVLENFDGHALTLKMEEVNSFQKDLIHTNRQQIEQCVCDIVNTEIKLKISYTMQDTKVIKENTNLLTKEEKDKVLQQMRSENKMVAKLIDEFDLELF